jgi:tRNA(His) 5'-end guanylyltransferase
MSSDKTTIGDRFKEYEAVNRCFLTRRLPVIMRLDGKAFHTITRKSFGKKWNIDFVNLMIDTAKAVQKDIQGCNFCYCQSDEISFIITDYKTINTDAWFNYNVNKMVSISASLASSTFSLLYSKPVCFDSRVFSIPQDEVTNYFIWRQIDATRNAIQMSAREYYSHKELNNKNTNEIQEMLFQKGINFNNYSSIRKRGFCIIDGKVDCDIPIFTQEREYINRHVYIRED